VPILLKSGSLNLLEPSGPVKVCNGIALPLTVYITVKILHVGDYVVSFSLALQPSAGYGLLVSRGVLITHNTVQSVGLLWARDQHDAETST
jgi:hypothetical protein